MNKLIGKIIAIHLLCDNEIIDGVLIDVDNESVYVADNSRAYCVPKSNIKYYSTDQFDFDSTVEPKYIESKKEDNTFNGIKVYIDENYIATLSPKFGRIIGNLPDTIVKEISSNSKIMAALENKVQKKIEYGEDFVNIETHSDAGPTDDNTFSAGVADSDFVTKELSPVDLAKIISKKWKIKKYYVIGAVKK